MLALREPTGKDLLADPIRGVLGEGSWCVEGSKRGRDGPIAHDPSSPANRGGSPSPSPSSRGLGEL